MISNCENCPNDIEKCIQVGLTWEFNLPTNGFYISFYDIALAMVKSQLKLLIDYTYFASKYNYIKPNLWRSNPCYRTIDRQNNMNGSQNDDAEQKKPEKGKYHTVCFHLYMILENAN